jgi:hypothetical protein
MVLLPMAKFAGTVKLMSLKNTDESPRVAVSATDGVLQEEQSGEVRQAQFRGAKIRRSTKDAFQSQAPRLRKRLMIRSVRKQNHSCAGMLRTPQWL